MTNIASEYLDRSISYEEYRQLINDLLAKGQATGENHSEEILEYTRLNVSRMKRLDKTARLGEETLTTLSQIDRQQVWLVITEGWCGDAAQIIPLLQKMAATNDLVELRLILRDENLPLMDAFLTNGGRSIPKLIAIDTADDNKVLGSWGPRPQVAQNMVMATKDELAGFTDPVARKKRYQESQQELHLWYAKDKTRSTQQELVELIREGLLVS